MLDYIIIGILSITLLVLVILLLNRKKDNHSKSDVNNVDVIKELNDFKETINKNLVDSKFETLKSNSEFQTKLNTDISKFKEGINESLFTINTHLNKNIIELNEKVENSLKGGFKETNQTFNEIKEKVTKIDLAQQNIETLSKEVVSLQNVLTNNQARGQFGEYQLNNLLVSLFGENKKLYDIQYTLSNNSRADAVVFLSEPLNKVCIDSKFSYASFSRLIDEKMDKEQEEKYIHALKQDLKKHIKDIHDKYIIEGETAPFAWMFIPSDALLSLIHYKMDEVIKFANNLHVSIVSPTLLLPLLTSYKVLNINLEQNKNAKLIKEQIITLDNEICGLKERWDTLNKQINTVYNNSSGVDIKVNKISKKFNEFKNMEEDSD